MDTPHLRAKVGFIAAVAALAAAAGAEAKEDPLRAIEFFRKSQVALRTTCPLTMRRVWTELLNGRPVARVSYTTIRNDADHFVARPRVALGTDGPRADIYMNGREIVSYDRSRNTYLRFSGPPASDDAMSVLVGWISYFTDTMSNREIGANSRIVATKYHGVSAYRVTLYNPKPRKPHRKFRLEAIIRRADYLPMRLGPVPRGGTGITWTFNYQRPSAPYPASTFVFVPPPRAREVSKAPTSKAVDLLRRSIDTGYTVEPVTIRWTTSESRHGRYTYRVWAVITRNDATHRVAKAGSLMKYGTEIGVVYVGGPDNVLYSPAKKRYWRSNDPSAYPDTSMGALSYRVNAAIHGMSDKDLKAHSRVSAVRFHGFPAYRVTVDNPKQTERSQPSHLEVIIGRVDLLPRQAIGTAPDGVRHTLTYTYERPSSPYPASTFVFVPPPGVKEGRNPPYSELSRAVTPYLR